MIECLLCGQKLHSTPLPVHVMSYHTFDVFNGWKCFCGTILHTSQLSEKHWLYYGGLEAHMLEYLLGARNV